HAGGTDAVDEGGTGHRHATGGVTVAADVLGGRVHDDVDTELHRTAERRGGEGGVDHERGPGLVCDLRERGQVGDGHRGVGQRLGEDHPGLGAHGGADGVRVGDVDEVGADPEAAQQSVQERVGVAVDGTGGDD